MNAAFWGTAPTGSVLRKTQANRMNPAGTEILPNKLKPQPAI
jgi:hypothetical protein